MAFGSELADALAPDSTDDEPFLRVAQKFAGPIDGTAVTDLHFFTGRSMDVNLAAKVSVITAAGLATVIYDASDIVELIANRL